ncbi:MAG TPA: hypothetical protein VEB43_06880 [Anaeromyxobacter sp.]|nr:hypothetical protein [Anaeromyxobacter sp.]
MSRLLGLAASLVAASLPVAASAADGGLRPYLDLEAGLGWARYNDVQVPGDAGTRFSLSDGAFSTETAPILRVQAGARWRRHALSATFAPVRLQGNGSSGETVVFRGESFTASEDASARYRFDSYRLTYRYFLVDAARFELALGATGLVRNAEIRLSQPGRSTAEKNVGVVPLASLRVAGKLGGPVWLALDGDALASTQGRAEDVSLALEVRSGELTFRAGYRLLEGGADDDEVYNFAWIHQITAGVRYEL